MAKGVPTGVARKHHHLSRRSSVKTSSFRLTFSGHETFQCRSLWLKKGYDFLREGHTFSQPNAVVRLGVGKNMVSSIRYWMNAFGFLSETDDLAKFLLGPRGKDRYLENIGSLWLLHQRLVTRGVASVFSLAFNELRKEKIEFTKENLLKFLKRKCQEHSEPFNAHIIERDIGVFLKTYVRPTGKVQNVEEDFCGIFLELGLVEEIDGIDDGLGKRYRIAGRERAEIPADVILSCILSDEKYGNSVSFFELLNGWNSVGSVFAMNSDGLMAKIEEIVDTHKDIVYKEDAGVREVQFKKKPDRWEILKRYYAD